MFLDVVRMAVFLFFASLLECPDACSNFCSCLHHSLVYGCMPSLSLPLCTQLMSDYGVSGVPVLGFGDMVLGMFSSSDLRTVIRHVDVYPR